MSDLLTAAAAGLSGAAPAFGEIPACVIGAALRPKEGEMVCGDTMEAFRTDSGLWCLLLADGMGSGDAARRESSSPAGCCGSFWRRISSRRPLSPP